MRVKDAAEAVLTCIIDQVVSEHDALSLEVKENAKFRLEINTYMLYFFFLELCLSVDLFGMLLYSTSPFFQEKGTLLGHYKL